MNDTEPLLSVIIPVYNVECYLVQCLDSVINGTYKNLEIIIIDDGSTDKSGAICDQYKERDGRIRVLHTENHGLSSARNEGLAIAKGDLLAFVDSDDWIELDTYTIAVQKMQESGADIVMFGFYSVKKNQTKKIAKDFMSSDHILTSAGAIDLLIDDEKVQNYAWNKLYKIKVFNNIQFPVGLTYEDLYIMHKVFLNANKIFVIGNCYKYYYRKRKGSIISTKTFKNTVHRTNGFLKRYEDLKNNNEINKSDLLNITFGRYVIVFCENPIKAKKLYGGRYKKFVSENQAAINSGMLNKAHKLFLKLPLPIFMLLYNGLTKRIYAAIYAIKHHK